MTYKHVPGIITYTEKQLAWAQWHNDEGYHAIRQALRVRLRTWPNFNLKDILEKVCEVCMSGILFFWLFK